MTPDQVAEMLRVLLREAMILAAPILIIAALLMVALGVSGSSGVAAVLGVAAVAVGEHETRDHVLGVDVDPDLGRLQIRPRTEMLDPRDRGAAGVATQGGQRSAAG